MDKRWSREYDFKTVIVKSVNVGTFALWTFVKVTLEPYIVMFCGKEISAFMDTGNIFVSIFFSAWIVKMAMAFVNGGITT